ncbi:MAG: ABC transporter [Actinobacteria bacterium]|jgi:lipooligosaccharide transport system permease protein|nr:MAG: ABC transporter [Actinomycetota bacterium]
MSYALALRSYEFWLAFYKRTWRGSLATSIVNPVFYLGALGVGLGTLVNRAGTTPGGVDYLAFVAPGVLAATAMQVGTTEASWPVLGSIRWTRVYYAMLATPLGIGDIVVGHQLWMATRVATSSAVYLAVIAAFGGIQSPLAVLALPACVLIGVAFAGPMAAYAATRERDGAFVPVMRFGIVPMFLFSGTFFPISRLPVVLEWVARATPLWHGVDLCRGLTLGTITWSSAVVHVAYLLVWAVGGVALAFSTYRRRLLK